MKKPVINLQAPEAESAAADGGTDKLRIQRSKRSYLAGTATADKPEEADGARYTLLGTGGGDIDYTFGKDPFADKCYAFFGFHTKIGNVANMVFNDKDEPGDVPDALAAINEFTSKLAQGIWAERTGGVGGQKIDRDALAGSIVHVKLAAGVIQQDQADAEYAKVRQRLEDDRSYLATARSVAEVAAEYSKRIGKATKTVADL